MSGIDYPLIAEGAHYPSALMGLRPSDGSGNSTTLLENWIPQCDTKWHKMFRELTFVVSVVGTTGTAPSAWSLGARFETMLHHTVGYQYQFPIWTPLQPEQIEECVAEGVGWYGGTNAPPADGVGFGIIADSTSIPDGASSGTLASELSIVVGGGGLSLAAPPARVTVARTVTHQMGGVRVRFDPQITGGDATTQIILSASAHGIY